MAGSWMLGRILKIDRFQSRSRLFFISTWVLKYIFYTLQKKELKQKSIS